MERMNYINRPKPAYTQEEWIEYLEESIRELRKEKENLKKEKGEIRQRLVKLEKNLETLSRVKENKELREENKKLKEKQKILDKENCELIDENVKLKKERDLYKARNEELNENCFGLSKENDKLKSDLANIQCEFGFECDECEFWKREIKKLKPNLIKEEYVFNLGDYDYIILTSTTPQLKIIKKKNKGASTFTIDGFTAVGKTFSSLADEEDLYEDIK